MLRRLIDPLIYHIFTKPEQMENTTKSLKLLRDGYMVELMEKIYTDDRFTELMMDISSEFVEQNIPIIDEDTKYDLALMMMESISVRSY